MRNLLFGVVALHDAGVCGKELLAQIGQAVSLVAPVSFCVGEKSAKKRGQSKNLKSSQATAKVLESWQPCSTIRSWAAFGWRV